MKQTKKIKFSANLVYVNFYSFQLFGGNQKISVYKFSRVLSTYPTNLAEKK